MGIVGRVAVLLLGVGPAFELAFALPPKAPLHCASPTTTSTLIFPQIQCLRQVCIPPESTCSPGEPTGKTPTPPRTATVTTPNDCTAIVEINNFGGCGLCPTCVSANPGGPIVTDGADATLTHINPGGPIITAPVPSTPPAAQSPSCSSITTVSTKAPYKPCACPMIMAPCPGGKKASVQALPTRTVTEGCTASVIVGPGCQCSFCGS
ncbi:unnamed protein product [Discula destructiva]